MMSTLATTLLAWSAVYAYLCGYYLLLYLRRSADREYLSFGLLCGGIAIYVGADAFVVDARTVQEAIVARRISEVGIIGAIAFFVEFQSELRRRRSPLNAIAYLWAGLGLLAESTGVFFTGEVTQPSWGWADRAGPIPAVTNIGKAYLLGLVVVSGLAVLPLFRRDRAQRDPLRSTRWTWTIAATGMVCLAAGVHDYLLRAGYLRAYPLVDHAFMLLVLVVSLALLDRFVGASMDLQERTAELHRSYEELRETQRRLVQKEQLAAVGELSAVIAHEIRNPLAIIKNSVSGLRRPTLRDEDRHTLLGILDEETSRLNRLMHDLLAYARPVVPRARELVVAEVLRRSVERATGGVSQAERVDVRWELGAPETIHGDPELLRHAFVNVVENALHAMPEGGTLTLRTRALVRDGVEAVAVEVADTGEGMDTIVREKARDPFFTTRPAGTGLGLAIVERVVRNHGGEVAIESRHGKGTVVRIVLPREPTSTFVPAPPPRSGRLSSIRERIE